MKQERSRKPFSIRGREVYLRAGELQYFRVQPQLWQPAIEKMRDAGFNAISTYVPWIVHEPEEGVWDFEGARSASANLLAFLDLCATHDMPVMIRPGPQIYAEFRGFGIPLWVGERHTECVMRGQQGNLVKGSFYYYYSLMHPTYLGLVESWLDRVVRELWPRFQDSILSYQLDNETGMPLANTLGNFDFNPDTVNRYRAFLGHRYAENSSLRSAWRRSSASLDTLLPPTHGASMAEASDWYAFLETWVAEYLDQLRQMAVAQGVTAPLVVNDLDIYLSPVAPAKKAGLAQVQGYDIYTKGSSTPAVADMPFAPSHDPERFLAMIAPDATFISVELGAGWFDPRARIQPVATVQATMGGVAHGLQGHSYYVAHDGRDPDGSPYSFHSFFDESGKPTERLKAVAYTHAFLAEHETELLASQTCYDDALYLLYQPYARLMPSDYLPGNLLPNPMLYLEAFGLHGMYDVLLTAGFLPRFADAETVTEDDLRRARVVILPTRGWLDSSTLEKLARYVEGGGHLITFPGVVSTDEHAQPHPTAARLYPLAPQRSRAIGYPTVFRYIFSDLIVKYLLGERWRLARREPAAMQNTDSFEGLKILLTHTLPSVRLHASSGHEFRGDYRLVTFSPDDARRLLAHGENNGIKGITCDLSQGRLCAGYTVQYAGGGSSAVIGAEPGGAYTTAAYYQIPADERRALREYVSNLLLKRGVSRQWSSPLDIECTVRRVTPTTCLVFLFNRLEAQRGEIVFSQLGADIESAEILWTYAGSYARVTSGNTLALEVAEQDVMVLRLSLHDAA